jgi:hypothetical protein
MYVLQYATGVMSRDVSVLGIFDVWMSMITLFQTNLVGKFSIVSI